MGGVRNGAAEEDWRWDLNPGTIARHSSQARGNHVALGLPLPRVLGSRRDLAGKERGERTLAGGP